jgi:predicted nucleic acid-binding Zn ribbon protein
MAEEKQKRKDGDLFWHVVAIAILVLMVVLVSYGF